MSTLEPVLGDTFLARKFNQTTPMTPVETVSPFPIASSTLPATTLGGTETIMQSTTDMPPAPLMSSTSTSFPLQTEQIGLKQVLPSETLSTQPIVSEGSEGVVGANVMAPASTSLVNQLPVITKELIHERPILEAVHERTFIERRTINNVQEIHEQPIIEIHEKPVIRTIQEAAEVKRFTAPNALREEINQPVSYTLPRPGTVQRIKEAYVAKVNVAPVVREVIRREHVRIIEQPMIVEVRHKPIIEIYEQPILRIFHEKPVFRTIKVAAVTEGITAAPVPLGAVPQQQVLAAPQPLQESLPLQSEASGQVISSSTEILSASNMGATTLPVSSSTQFLPSSTLSSSTLQGTALPATSSFSSSTASSMNTGPVLVPDAPVGAGLRSGQVVGSSTEILPTSAAGATSLGAVPQQQFMSAPMQAAPAQSVLPPIFKEQRLDQSGLPSNIAMFLKSSQSPAPLANASMPGTVYRSPIV